MENNREQSVKVALDDFFRLQNDPEFIAKQQAMLRQDRKAFLTGFGPLMFGLMLVAGAAGLYLAHWLMHFEGPSLLSWSFIVGIATCAVVILYPR